MAQDFGALPRNAVRCIPLKVAVDLILELVRDQFSILPGDLRVRHATPLAEVLLRAIFTVASSFRRGVEGEEDEGGGEGKGEI